MTKWEKIIVGVLLWLAYTIAAMTLGATLACGHEAHSGMKYDAECCSNRDCAPVTKMEPLPEGGWRVTNEHGHTAEFMSSFKEIRQSKDHRNHACITPTAQVPLCLYLAPGV